MGKQNTNNPSKNPTFTYRARISDSKSKKVIKNAKIEILILGELPTFVGSSNVDGIAFVEIDATNKLGKTVDIKVSTPKHISYHDHKSWDTFRTDTHNRLDEIELKPIESKKTWIVKLIWSLIAMIFAIILGTVVGYWLGNRDFPVINAILDPIFASRTPTVQVMPTEVATSTNTLIATIAPTGTSMNKHTDAIKSTN